MKLLSYIWMAILSMIASVLPAQTLTIMSYNIHHGADKEEKDQLAAIGAFIKTSGADIAGLQEVDSMCTRSGNMDQMKELPRITGMYYAFVRHYAYQGGAYGMGILSRFPITDVENRRMTLLKSKTPSTAMISALIRLSGKKNIRFASAHFALDDSSRMLQAQETIGYLTDEPHPVIFTGDLNATPSSPEVKYLETYFTDTDGQQQPTYPAPQAVRKIDYILVATQYLVKVKQFVVPVNALSDHLPVVTTIQIKE